MNTEGDTLTKIKLAALNSFNEKGYFATTTRDIASEVGIKSSTLYFYFKSKEDIFLTLYREARDIYDKKKQLNLIENIEGGIEKQLYHLFCISMELFAEHNQYCKLLFRYFIYPEHCIHDNIKAELKEWKNTSVEYIINLFERGIQDKIFIDLSPEALAKTFYRNLNGYTYELIVYDRIPNKEEIDEVWKIYWNSIKA
jgi:TetR/AcrR family transcriptional regulator, cmeABC operon repressor